MYREVACQRMKKQQDKQMEHEIQTDHVDWGRG